jgi:hypothetical protein
VETAIEKPEISSTPVAVADFNYDIDCTPVDVQVVDKTRQEVAGRPSINLVMDAHSRRVVGFRIILGLPKS